jgi:hypothetical protein
MFGSHLGGGEEEDGQDFKFGEEHDIPAAAGLENPHFEHRSGLMREHEAFRQN